jgi:enoyl-CoA hydratase/carnithine racemase
MPILREEDSVFVLDLGADENRFSLSWIETVHALLDSVVEQRGQTVLVTTGTGKFYSNGLDLPWLLENGERSDAYVGDVQELLARVLTLPVPTVAAVNGHAFGAGAMLALAHDFRVMRADRGYFCFPEVDINIPFTQGMAALIQAKLTPGAAIASMTTGRWFGGLEAQTFGLVDGIAEAADLLSVAADAVRPLLGKDGSTLTAIKSTMFAPTVTALRAAAVAKDAASVSTS